MCLNCQTADRHCGGCAGPRQVPLTTPRTDERLHPLSADSSGDPNPGHQDRAQAIIGIGGLGAVLSPVRAGNATTSRSSTADVRA